MLRCQFLCYVLKASFFIKIALKFSYFCKKNTKFSSAGGSAPRPPCLRRLGVLPPDPQPPSAGGFAPAPPLPPTAGGSASRPPTHSPSHCEFLATRLLVFITLKFSEFPGPAPPLSKILRTLLGPAPSI